MKLHQLALVIEPNPASCEHLRTALDDAGFDVLSAPCGADGLSAIGVAHPDVVVTNTALPDMTGAELSRKLGAAEAWADLPVILFQFSSPRGPNGSHANAFLVEPGGMQCPMTLPQLALRAASLARPRAARLTGDLLRAGMLHVDTGAHRAHVADAEVPLTAIEFRLLVTLMSTADRVLTRDRLLRDVWGVRGRAGTRTIDTHIKRLRRKLGTAGSFIETVRNVGYRFGTATSIESGEDQLQAAAHAATATPLDASSATNGSSPRGEAS